MRMLQSYIPLGSSTHIIGIILYLLILVFSCIFIKKIDMKKRKFIVFFLLSFGFCLHFAKLLFPPYRNLWPKSIRKVTFENICAVSTICFPFFYLSKNKYLRDYMFYLGLISGTAAILFPMTDYYPYFTFDTFRYYICHIIISLAPLLMVVSGIHHLNYHRILMVSVIFIIVEGLLAINDVFMVKWHLNDHYTNFSLPFGLEEKHLNALGKLQNIILIFVPVFLRNKNYIFSGITTQFVPVAWLIIPVFIYLTLGSFLLSLIFDFPHIQSDFRLLKNKFKKVHR